MEGYCVTCLHPGIRKILALLIALITKQAAGMSAIPDSSKLDEEPHHWAKVASRDLAFVRDTIDAAHPGGLEKDDLPFHAWREEGYHQAQALAARASSERQAIAAVRFYAIGFQDGHLAIWSDAAHQQRRAWTGWLMQQRDGGYFVSARASRWPIALPPIGARILECDDRPVSSVIHEDIMPFTDRRVDLTNVRRKLVAHVTMQIPIEPLWRDTSPQSCVAEFPDGRRERIPLLWREDEEGIRQAFSVARRPQGMQYLDDGTVWVDVTDFQLDKAGFERLEILLAQLRALDTAKMVIVDTRGNGGGNSAIGDRILRALLKQTMPPEPLQASAWWRVSQIAIDHLQGHADRYRAFQGETGEEVRWIDGILSRMRTAQKNGVDWAQNSFETEPDEITNPEDTGAPFQGRLGLVTDANCASACLDFADAVLRIPGAIHLGEATSADTNYLDVTQLRLPSGLMMCLPLKVWRGRARGSNEALIPQFAYDGDINDTVSLQKWVLDTMRK